MKVYVHLEGGGGPPLTRIYRDAQISTWTAEQLLQAFAATYNASQSPSVALNSRRLSLHNAKQKTIPLTSLLSRACMDGEDLFVVPTQHTTATAPVNVPALSVAIVPLAESSSAGAVQGSTVAAARPATLASSNELAFPQNVGSSLATQNTSTSTKDKACSAGSGGSSALMNVVVEGLLHRADTAAEANDLRTAEGVYKKVLQLYPDHVATLRRLAELWLRAGQPSRGIPYAQQAVDACSDDWQANNTLAVCLRDAGRPQESLPYFEAAINACPEDGTTAGRANHHTLHLDLARALWTMPEPATCQDAAASLVMQVLGEDECNFEGLSMYAEIAAERGMVQDALQVVLRLIVRQPKHAPTRKLLARCVQGPEGVAPLLAELGAGAGSAAALAFLATCIKDHCAVRTANLTSKTLQPGPAQPFVDSIALTASISGASGDAAAAMQRLAITSIHTSATHAATDHSAAAAVVQLFRRAVAAEPTNASYSLNLLHTLELQHDFGGAVAVGVAFLNAAVAAGNTSTAWQGLPFQGVLDVLEKLGHFQGITSPWQCGSLANESNTAAVATDAQRKVQYSADSLDALALLYALTKITFVGGALRICQSLADILEPALATSAVPLHTTIIRNEAAYFSCIHQLLKNYPPPGLSSDTTVAAANSAAEVAPSVGSSTSVQPLYLLGDSHCLSGAWRHVTLRCQQRLLRPVLVTGCKLWHLRPDSDFYPKLQFDSAVAQLPDGAQLVLLLGEIDCREGLLLAVRKCKYETLQEGIDATVAICIALLRRLITTRAFEVFVHPTPPVLDETRPIVVPFEAALRKAVMSAAAEPELAGRLHYMDFFSTLLVIPRYAGGSRAPTQQLRSGTDTDAREVNNEGGHRCHNSSQTGGAGNAGIVDVARDVGNVGCCKLCPDFSLDGTHMSPKYLAHLSNALQQVV